MRDILLFGIMWTHPACVFSPIYLPSCGCISCALANTKQFIFFCMESPLIQSIPFNSRPPSSPLLYMTMPWLAGSHTGCRTIWCIDHQWASVFLWIVCVCVWVTLKSPMFTECVLSLLCLFVNGPGECFRTIHRDLHNRIWAQATAIRRNQGEKRRKNPTAWTFKRGKSNLRMCFFFSRLLLFACFCRSRPMLNIYNFCDVIFCVRSSSCSTARLSSKCFRLIFFLLSSVERFCVRCNFKVVFIAHKRLTTLVHL